MATTIASYLSEGQESLVVLALKHFAEVLPTSSPLVGQVLDLVQRLDDSTWLCETTLPPDEVDFGE